MPLKSVYAGESPKVHFLDWQSQGRQSAGTGVPLLLTHGMAGSSRWWDSCVPFLQPAFRPVAMDFRGHGDSEWVSEGTYDTDGFVQDIETVREAMGFKRMVLGSHSLGARIALEYALRHPERLLGLVAVDFLPEFYEANSRKFERARTRPQPVYEHEEEILRRFHLEPPGTLLSPEELKAMAPLCVRKIDGQFTWKFDWKAFKYKYEPVWPLLSGIKAPALVVRGEKSTVMSREAFGRAVRDIPNARGAEIPQAHHHVPLDSPRELAALMTDFLQKLPQEKIRFIRAESGEQLEEVRRLFKEYEDFLGFNLCFQDFDRELASLPGEYAPPEGRLFLALCEDRIAGCAALRKLDAGVCEMKRMYVRPEFRGKKIGRALAAALIEEARKIGYRRMRLDTVSKLKEAIALYRSLGFKDCKPYRHNPIEGAIFMELVFPE